MATDALRVRDVMQREIVTLQRSDRLDLVDDVMRLGRIRHMPVLASGRVVGIVSNRDLLAAGLSRALDFDASQRRAFLRSVEVTGVMSEKLVSIEPEATLREAAERMAKHVIGCLPVVEPDGRFVGLVTETDLIRAAWLTDGPAQAPEEGVLAELGDRIEREMDAVRRVRDEIRLKLHLARRDARDRFAGLEQRWHELEKRVEGVAQEAREPVQEMGEALSALVEELKEGYRRIRAAL